MGGGKEKMTLNSAESNQKCPMIAPQHYRMIKISSSEQTAIFFLYYPIGNNYLKNKYHPLLKLFQDI